MRSPPPPLQPCVFRVDYVLEQAGGKEFGSVFVNEKENAALSLVAQGWAKVRPPSDKQSPFYEELARAQADAEAKGLGVHTKDKDAAAAAVRDVLAADGTCSGDRAIELRNHCCCGSRQCLLQTTCPPGDFIALCGLPAYLPAEFDTQGLLSRVGKGKPVSAIVEQVSSGSMLRVTLLPELQSATVMVAGVQCPSMGRRPPPTAAPAAPAADGEEAAATGPAAGTAASLVAAGTSAPSEVQAEPFAREARYFTELRTLNREVKIVLEGVSQVCGGVAS